MDATAAFFTYGRTRKRERSYSCSSSSSISSCSSSSSEGVNRNKRNRKLYRTSRTSRTSLPSVGFHHVHGENVRISRDGSTATRTSLGKGVVFSARPVSIDEKVYIRFGEMSNSWTGSGALRFGFTVHNPETPGFRPDLTMIPGNWTKDLEKQYCEKNNVLHYYVNGFGEVYFGINGVDKGKFFSGVSTNYMLWALVNMQGKCSEIQYVDPTAPKQEPNSPVEDETLASSMRTLHVEQTSDQKRFVQLILHENDKDINSSIASSCGTEFEQKYAFTKQQISSRNIIIIEILATEASGGNLAFGVTSCDPTTPRLRNCDLPKDLKLLKTRPGYWMVNPSVASGLKPRDKISVTLTKNGEVRISRNGSKTVSIMHVDHNLTLWAFMVLNGATHKSKMVDSQLKIKKLIENCDMPINTAIDLTSGEEQVIYQSSDNVIDLTGDADDCWICYKNPIDSFLYLCGHARMCYKCAVTHFNNKAKCLQCHASILGVLRFYSH